MLAFIHINKTAGRTLRYILRSSFGLRHCEVEPWHAAWTGPPFSAQDLKRVRKLYPRLESIAGHRVTGYADLDDGGGAPLKYFTFMRDPLKTCASRFQYNVQYRGKQGLDFDDWIQKDWTRNHQTRMIAGTADVSAAIEILRTKQVFVGLTERFDESLLLLKTLVANRLNLSYEPVNVSSANVIAPRLLADERTRELLIEANQVDQQLYDFVAKELYPSFQRAYGPSLEADVAAFQGTRHRSFHRLNLMLSRLKQFLVYRPLLYLNRRGLAVV
jgi:hypothetical protein